MRNINDICTPTNIPRPTLKQASIEKVENLSMARSLPVYCVCRRGIDSRSAVSILQKKGFHNAKDVSGGLTQWTKTVNPKFPMY